MLLASQVLWKDGSLHPMNLAVARWRAPGQMAQGIADGLVAMRNASFCSVALRREAIERFGLPLAHFFIWTDDVEFTSRVLRGERGYLVPESRVYHWTAEPHTAITATGDRFYFHVRNSLLLLRGSSLTAIERLDYGRYWARTLFGYLRARRFERAAVAVVVRGIRDGLRGEVR